jgi:hypothetical protein
METLQCPRCALRFRFASELRDHLDHDHSEFEVHAKTTSADLLDACHCHHQHPVGNGPHHTSHENNAA